MKEGIEKRFLDVEKHLEAARAALKEENPENVLSEVRKLNVYVQDLLVMSHKYRAHNLEEKRAQNQRAGGAPGVGEQAAPGATGTSPQEP